MSRTLKQVYSENVYVEFRFQSSLRKYERQPTKKIKCEPQCQHCIHHHQRCSPSRPNSFLSKGKLNKQWGNSIERPSEQRSYISESKSIRLSKQKSPAPPPDLALLQKNIYRNLVHDNKGKVALQKSIEDINSSIEEEIFFNDFCQDVTVEMHKENQENDFHKIQLKNVVVDEGYSTQMKQQKKEEQFQAQANNNKVQSLIQQRQDQREDYQVQNNLLQMENNQIHNLNQVKYQIKEESQVKSKQNYQIEYTIPTQAPIFLNNQRQQNQNWIQPHNQPISDFQQPKQNQNEESKIEAISIPEENMINQLQMQKCLAFDGGRIYVDALGQSFYISIRFLNRLKKKCPNMEELTNALISQRPYLQSRKDQIKLQLEQYMSSLD